MCAYFAAKNRFPSLDYIECSNFLPQEIKLLPNMSEPCIDSYRKVLKLIPLSQNIA